jgi:hypothetical protein
MIFVKREPQAHEAKLDKANLSAIGNFLSILFVDDEDYSRLRNLPGVAELVGAFKEKVRSS